MVFYWMASSHMATLSILMLFKTKEVSYALKSSSLMHVLALSLASLEILLTPMYEKAIILLRIM